MRIYDLEGYEIESAGSEASLSDQANIIKRQVFVFNILNKRSAPKHTHSLTGAYRPM